MCCGGRNRIIMDGVRVRDRVKCMGTETHALGHITSSSDGSTCNQPMALLQLICSCRSLTVITRTVITRSVITRTVITRTVITRTAITCSSSCQP